MKQLSFFRNRFYDQASGRWTQEDPIGIAGGPNLYQFNRNNPVSNSDPFGLCTPPDSPQCKFILAVAGRVQPLENVLNGVGDLTGLNALGQGAEQVTSGEVGSGLLSLGMAAIENSPEGRGAKGSSSAGRR